MLSKTILKDPIIGPVITQIDQMNSHDPNPEDGKPGELLYSERMTDMLEKYYPQASYNLQIAARGQHIARWKIPRDQYDKGKIGYHQWRRALIDLHTNLVLKILTENGYDEEDKQYISDLIGKKDLKSNPESQVLEDVVCLVFFEYYVLDFAKKHEDKNIDDILNKVFRKMSKEGKAFIPQLTNKPVVDMLMKHL
jgi:hypothetical protein